MPKIKTTRSFLAYGEAGKRVLHFQADLSEVCLEYSSITNGGSDWTSIFPTSSFTQYSAASGQAAER